MTEGRNGLTFIYEKEDKPLGGMYSSLSDRTPNKWEKSESNGGDSRIGVKDCCSSNLSVVSSIDHRGITSDLWDFSANSDRWCARYNR